MLISDSLRFYFVIVSAIITQQETRVVSQAVQKNKVIHMWSEEKGQYIKKNVEYQIWVDATLELKNDKRSSDVPNPTYLISS